MLQRLHSLQEEMHSEYLKEEAKKENKDFNSDRPFAMFAKPDAKVTPKKKDPQSNHVQEEEKENPISDKVAALKEEKNPVSKSASSVCEEIKAALGEKSPVPKRPLRQIVSDTSNTNIVNSNIIVSCPSKLTDYREKFIDDKGESNESDVESLNSEVIDGGKEVLDQGDRLIGAHKSAERGKDFIDQMDSEMETNESKNDKQAVIKTDSQVPGCSGEQDSGESGGFDPSDSVNNEDGWTCSICGDKPKNQVLWKPNYVCVKCGMSPVKDSADRNTLESTVERNLEKTPTGRQHRTSGDSGRKRDGITVEERKMRIKRSLSPSYYSEDLHYFKKQKTESEDILACEFSFNISEDKIILIFFLKAIRNNIIGL